MPTLGNIVARKAGVSITPRFVELTLAIPQTTIGLPRMETVRVALVPVSEKAKAAAFRAAEAYVDECQRTAAENKTDSDAPSLEDERGLRFIAAAMRDAEDARKAFVDDIDTFRDCLIAEQLRLLLVEYNTLINTEYHEVATANDVARMKAEAKATFQPGQG